jgi:hypothetical protein
VLEEEIVTKNYVMRHADLSSSEDETPSLEGEECNSRPSDEGDGEGESDDRLICVDEYALRGRRKRKNSPVSDSPLGDTERGREQISRSTSARRTKRKKRRWEWTLEAIEAGQDVLHNNPEDIQVVAPIQAEDGATKQELTESKAVT